MSAIEIPRQFHQSYSYEDFVEGFRPTATGFELRPGKFVEFCRQAEADPTHIYVFIIDEINRGNLSKILGGILECPAQFVPVEVRQTGTRGAEDGARQEA